MKMKKRKEVNVVCHNLPDPATDMICQLIDNDRAWADLILSKTALILASVVILTAVYALAASSSDVIEKNELELITVDLASHIDSAGSIHPGTENLTVTYVFDTYAGQLISHERLNISVTGEYVTSSFEDDGNTICAARALSYRTVPFSPENLRSVLTGKFAADGTRDQPINSPFPYTDVTDLLSSTAAEELYLNTSRDVIIEQASVFVTDGSEVRELEYILVHQ
ncbi:hypothetical protein [Methanolobus profundi]|uniref:Uncharacterized protein n=1 Tax=Methanolobus profundi TaxID=487685 RepID=A0A1I4NMX5_9EURY|nr:hypothetical protein [Methanolobus profundi]SFM16839.1 hypothetical protein SAMN04488696_0159 [Methanolobus profundi]